MQDLTPILGPGTVLEALDLSTVELALCGVAALAGAVIQGAVGFGYALVVVPTLLILAPEVVPVTPLVVALPMVVVQAVAERRALDPVGFVRLTAGRIPGTVLGVWVLTVVSPSTIAVIAGALLICAVVASVLRGARSTSPRLEVAAGFASGVAGTVGAVGGPYMGLAYADRPGPVMRATISLAFAAGLVISLTAIGIAGEIEPEELRLGAGMVPFTFLGLWAGLRLSDVLDRGPLRPAVLTFAAAAGLFALLRGLL